MKFNIFIIFYSLIFFIILGEIAVRFFSPALLEHQRMFIDGDYMHSPILRKNLDMTIGSGKNQYHLKTNSLGLRSLKEFNKSDNNILILGDSFTFGLGVSNDETYPYQLEQLLGDNYTVINAGFADGWGTDTEYLFLKTKIKQLNPDIVLVGISLASDLYDVWKNEWITDEKGLPVDIIHIGSRIPRFIKYYSGIYQFLRVRVSPFITMLGKKVDVKDNEPFPFVQETWDKIERLLLEMRKITEANNAEFVIIFIPGRHRNVTEFYTHLVSFCIRENIMCIDLLEIFKEYSEDKVKSMHIPGDGHLSVKGGKIYAEEIYKYLYVYRLYNDSINSK